MRKLSLPLLAFVLVQIGCAGSPAQTTWRANENNQHMADLKPDMTTQEVLSLMGTPDKTEMYRGKNHEVVLTYLYITQGMDTYTRTWNESNYTPLIFINNRLHGWGWSALDTTAERYELVIKER